ncbi:efflux transporter outer membrane subunit [Frateuria aurantia]
MFKPRRLGLACVLALSGCAVGPDFHKPEAPAHAGYQTPDGALSDTTAGDGQGLASQAQQLVPGQDIPAQWWQLFHSPKLDALIKRALARNPDLDAAQQSLKAAWEQVKAEQGSLFPQISGSFNPTRNRTGRALSPIPADNTYLYNLHTAQVNVSYAPDIWGGTRRQIESDKAQAELQRFQLEATYLTLTSNLVNAAITQASLRAQLAATQQMVASQQSVLDSYLRQQQLGQTSDADVAAQRALLGQTQASLPPLQKALAQQHDLIAALCGDTPDQPAPDFDLDELHLPEQLPVSLPAQLITQRPDVRAAEASWHSASALVGVALANRLPNLQIDASYGGVAASIGKMLTSGNGFWSIAGSLTQPLFDGGTLRHQEKAARDQYAQASAQYRSTVISAIQNVADTLQAIHADADALLANRTAEQASARSLQLAQTQYGLGDVAEVTVLSAQQSHAQAQLALIQAQAARLSDSTALFQALGGGWWHRQDVPADEAR